MHDNFDTTLQRRRPGQPGSARRGPRERPQARPDRFALWAVVLGVIAMFAGVASADGALRSSGAIGTAEIKTKRLATKYRSIYASFKQRDKRWARRTSKCESGHNPKALSPNKKYRGAFQFTRRTWRSAPKSPGGDPIDYTWKTQAVVAIAHRKKAKRMGWPDPWPNCPKPKRKR